MTTKANSEKCAHSWRKRLNDHREWIIFAMLAVGVVGIWVTMGIFASMQCNPGTFGDMFGFPNSLFSGLAFAGIIYTIYLQRQELRLQREEIRLQREELKRSAEAQEESAESLDKQVKLSAISAKINALSTLFSDAKQNLEDLREKEIALLESKNLLDLDKKRKQDRLNIELSEAEGRCAEFKRELIDLTRSLNLHKLEAFLLTSDL